MQTALATCRAPAGSAGTSISTGPRPLVPGLPEPKAPLVPPARITNEGSEWLKDHKKHVYKDFIDVETIQIPEPELGPLQRRVELSYQEAINRGEPNLKDMDYWFTPPPEGWNEPVRTTPAEIVPNEDVVTLHTEPDRTPLSEVEGTTVKGTVVAHLYYHGILVDIGAEHDGLIPLEMDEWRDIPDTMDVGGTVTVTVHKAREPDLYRWPVQLKMHTPFLEVISTVAPDTWYCPMDIGEHTLEELNERLGRDFRTLEFHEDNTTGLDAFQGAGFEDMYGAKAERPKEGTSQRDRIRIDEAAAALAASLDG